MKKKIFSREQIEQFIKVALDKLVEKDNYLFTIDANERALSHRMAIYLEEIIDKHDPDWNIDCEYNRDVTQPKKPYSKKLHLGEPPPDYTDGPYEDENATTVFPDIIIHKRGKSGDEGGNLLVIEVKKSTSTVGDKFDKEKKLPGYIEHFGYQYACFILLYTRDQVNYQFEFIN